MRYATFQIDLDDVWAVQQAQRNYRRTDSFFLCSIERCLSIFESFGLRVTFFVTGRDLENPNKRAVVKAAALRGHEIANHSWQHLSRFMFLNQAQLQKEVEVSHELISQHIGISPVGFKAPHYNFRPELISILQTMGYWYDSSLLPTPLAPVLRGAARVLFSQTEAHFFYLSSVRYGFSPLNPYPFASFGLKRKNLYEWPVSALPLLRLPFNMSYILALEKFGLGIPYFVTGLQLCKRLGVHLNFAIHLIDLADNNAISAFPFYRPGNPSLEKRTLLIKLFIEKIISFYHVIPTRDLFLEKNNDEQ